MRIHKVLSLPAILTPGDVYLEKTAVGVKMHVISSEGSDVEILAKPTLEGPLSLFYGESGNYYITEYNKDITYVVTSSNGVVVRTDDLITFTVFNIEEQFGYFSVNGSNFTVTLKSLHPATPVILSPVDNAESVSIAGLELISSEFELNYSEGVDTHLSSDWEISTDPDFINIVASSYGSVENKTTFTPP